MAINSDVLKERLKETFGTESQETVGKKLNMTQGNISKLLSGSQQPTLETVFHVAQTYGVSVDWLLGLSNKKHIVNYSPGITYTSAVKTLLELKKNGTTMEYNEANNCVNIQIGDALLNGLMKKAITLMDTDREVFHSWVENKLSLFEDKPILLQYVWMNQPAYLFVSQAAPMSAWLEAYEKASHE